MAVALGLSGPGVLDGVSAAEAVALAEALAAELAELGVATGYVSVTGVVTYRVLTVVALSGPGLLARARADAATRAGLLASFAAFAQLPPGTDLALGDVAPVPAAPWRRQTRQAGLEAGGEEGEAEGVSVEFMVTTADVSVVAGATAAASPGGGDPQSLSEHLRTAGLPDVGVDAVTPADVSAELSLELEKADEDLARGFGPWAASVDMAALAARAGVPGIEVEGLTVGAHQGPGVPGGPTPAAAERGIPKGELAGAVGGGAAALLLAAVVLGLVRRRRQAGAPPGRLSLAGVELAHLWDENPTGLEQGGGKAERASGIFDGLWSDERRGTEVFTNPLALLVEDGPGGAEYNWFGDEGSPGSGGSPEWVESDSHRSSGDAPLFWDPTPPGSGDADAARFGHAGRHGSGGSTVWAGTTTLNPLQKNGF